LFWILKTKEYHLIQGIEALLRVGFLTIGKLSPDCPLVEVLKEPKDDKYMKTSYNNVSRLRERPVFWTVHCPG
jgi:hypothetical protein